MARSTPGRLLLWLAVTSCAYVVVSAAPNNNERGISMGTTIVALKSKQGVIVGADTRTSQGAMVSNRFAEKISIVYQQGHVSCVLCRSGSAADSQALADQARWKFQERALRYNGMAPTISQIAQWLRCCIRSGNCEASLLCVGYDSTNTGKIMSISQSGAMLEEPVCAASGSGSAYILGMMDNVIKEEGLMEEQDAVDFVARLIHLAMARDGASGGMARIVVMNRDGLKEMVVPPPGESLDKKETSTVLLSGFQAAAK